MVDVHTRWTWVTLLRSLKHTFTKCTKKLLKHLSPLTKIFRSDLGSEFDNTWTKEFLSKLGIIPNYACAGDHYQNGLAETMIRLLYNMARTFLADAKLPLSFWGEALVCACFVKNRLPTSALNGKSPYEACFGKKFNMRRLRAFGSHCTVMKHPDKLTGNKTRSRSYKGIMIGYGDPFGLKGWRVYVPKLKRVVTSPNVLFFDSMQQSIAHRDPNLVVDTNVDSIAPWPATAPDNTSSDNRQSPST